MTGLLKASCRRQVRCARTISISQGEKQKKDCANGKQEEYFLPGGIRKSLAEAGSGPETG